MLIASEAGAVVTDFSGASACIGSEALVASRDMESHSRVLAALGAGLPVKPPFNKN
jgi:fructose-1,6-bisphosphatase/inositol monophosphatase family enzyme